MRSLFPDLRKDGPRHAKAGLLQFVDRVIENDEPGLIRFIENGERARNLQPSPNRLLSAGLLINEHHFGMYLGCERNRLALSQVELRQNETVLRTENYNPLRRIVGPGSDRFWRDGMPQLCEHGGWNQNSRVELLEEVDLRDQKGSALRLSQPELT